MLEHFQGNIIRAGRFRCTKQCLKLYFIAYSHLLTWNIFAKRYRFSRCSSSISHTLCASISFPLSFAYDPLPPIFILPFYVKITNCYTFDVSVFFAYPSAYLHFKLLSQTSCKLNAIFILTLCVIFTWALPVLCPEMET